MGDKLDKTKEKLNKKEISNLRFIIFLVGIGVFIFMDTEMFRNLEDALKILVYMSLWGTFAVFGIELMPAKEIGLKIKDIYNNKSLNLEQKCNEFGHLGMDLLHKAGEMWQVSLEEQFPGEDISVNTATAYYDGTEGIIYPDPDGTPDTKEIEKL